MRYIEGSTGCVVLLSRRSLLKSIRKQVAFLIDSRNPTSNAATLLT